jgi:hypothetical protein
MPLGDTLEMAIFATLSLDGICGIWEPLALDGKFIPAMLYQLAKAG